MGEFKRLTRKQIDEKVDVLRDANLAEIPRGGWVKTIRKALSMSSEALGNRIGVTQSAISQSESSEESESITLASLRRLANGLECDLVYALVPRKPLDEILREQAIRRATGIVRSVSASMELEDQGISAEEETNQIESLVLRLLEKTGPGFWDDL